MHFLALVLKTIEEKDYSLNNEISGDIIPSEVKSGTAQLLFKTPNIWMEFTMFQYQSLKIK
jgi:hypothetical protein